MNRKKLVESIIELLVVLKTKISTYNQAGLYDIDTFSEDFFQRLLNLVFDYNLVNINITERKNYPGIDLGDKDRKISIQVTADGGKTKVNETIKLFLHNELYKQFNQLKMLILKEKTRFKDNNFDTQDKFNFDPLKDIYDIDDLVALIRVKDVPELEIIKNLLVEELVERDIKEDVKTSAREVETIMDLIELLSNQDTKPQGDNQNDPDPDKKIYKRFKDYSDFLVTEIQELIPSYAIARLEAIDKMGLDTVKAKRIARYLKTKSDTVLIECNDDPRLALVTLTDYFENKLGDGGKSYEYNAIRFFLIQEIINCNVFPNDFIIT